MRWIPKLRRWAAALLVVALVCACAGGSPGPAATESATTATALPVSSPLVDDDVRGEAPPASAPGRATLPTAAPATPKPRPPTPTLPPAEPFAINLHEPGDKVSQYTFDWCVGASIQMTLAMTGRSDDMSRDRQQRLWEMARDTSFSPFGGANPIGWVATLNELGVGPYEMVSEPSLEAALRRAARAIVETSRPVGLVMWRGRHAWVMSGFESLGDPRTRADFRITGVNVLDPLHPHGNARWGPSPAPNELVTPEVVGAQFVARTGGLVQLPVAPGYILVLPTAEA